MGKIINIGCRYFKNNPQKTGGVVVLFEQWLDYCSNNVKNNHINIDSNKSNYKNKFVGILKIFIQIKRALGNKSINKIVFLHCTLFDILVLAPIVERISHKHNAKFIIRKFAGDFETRFNSYPSFIQNYIKSIISKADATFWESKSLVQFGKKYNPNSFWFPNVREKAIYHRDCDRQYEKKFVFISRVQKEKGILLLANCFKNLSQDYTLDIYGHVEGLEIRNLECDNVKYRGTLYPNEVQKVLTKYDVLCLPTDWEGEGYPGIIIEAFSVGIPVISTYKGGIPELIEDKKNGLLIQPNDAESLLASIKWFNDAKFKLMAKRSLESFASFNADIVNNRIMSIIKSI